MTRTMKQILGVFTAISLLCLQVCIGDKSCVMWSSAGQAVQRSSNFTVYCTFNLRCRYSMYSGHPPQAQSHQVHNSSTIYLQVVNITEDRTYSCDCDDLNTNSHNKPDSCGRDIIAGYPPDRPTNFSCICKVADERRSVVCKWSSGRQTYLRNSTTLCFRTYPPNRDGDSFSVSAKGSSSLSADFTVDASVQNISVWAYVQNQLGSAESSVINYTLSDIVMPPAPVLLQAECSSRNCSLRVERFMTQHLQVSYSSQKEDWTSSSNTVVNNGWVHVPSLQPYKLYHFRARSRFSTGLWSEWSTYISIWTQEEVPAKALDVWYAVDRSQKSMSIYWKEADISIARGRILDYMITLYSQNSTMTFNVSSSERSLSAPFCANCVITVHARNSKGLSPAANITTHNRKAKPPGVQVKINKQNVTISWGEPERAPRPAEYVVEWYPQGQRLERLKWVRMGGNSSHVVITDMMPFVCYEGAVYVFYGDSSVGMKAFTHINTVVSVPSAGPFVQEKVDGDTVNVSWSELPMSQSGGCVTNYTIYLENNSCPRTSYNISASQRYWVKKGLSPAVYSIWMTASTMKGEGRPGQKVKFFIQQDSQLSLVLIFGGLIVVIFLLVCVCQSPAVKERIWVYFQCLKLEVIPDPANSKWAKECLLDKQGKVDLHLQLSTSTVSEEEEEPVLVDIQELPKPPPLTRFSTADSDPPSSLYPATTYIKSLSHDSDSSDNTRASLDTNETVDYISSHGTDAMFDEDADDIPCFFPSHSVFSGPVDFGAKLTLDAVRINGGDFFIQCE